MLSNTYIEAFKDVAVDQNGRRAVIVDVLRNNHFQVGLTQIGINSVLDVDEVRYGGDYQAVGRPLYSISESPDHPNRIERLSATDTWYRAAQNDEVRFLEMLLATALFYKTGKLPTCIHK